MKPMEPLLARLADSVVSARTTEQLTRPLLEMLQAVTGLESTYLTTIDLGHGVQQVLYACNTGELQIPEGLSAPWEDTLCRRALEEGRSHTDDVGGCWGDSEAASQLGIQTYMSTAVRTEAGGLYGTLCGASSEKVPLAPNAEKILGMFSRLIAQHVERETLLAQLQKANTELATFALTDALTGLPNRRALMLELSRILSRAQREGTPVHVAVIDLDEFKTINDEHGHQVGDRFLVEMAERLVAGLRASDLIARLGGDEFVVVAHASADEQSAQQLRELLVERTTARFGFDDIDIDYRGASVGLVTAGLTPASAEQVLAEADAAMYAVKRARRGSALS